MQQRLTDIFPQLLSQESQSQDEDQEATGGQQSNDEEYDDVPEY